jgi:hypothetical protein
MRPDPSSAPPPAAAGSDRRARPAPAVALALAALAAAAPAAAELCGVDRNPAATVLLPYFEVDLAHGASGETTLFELANASPRAVLARVTLWTDLGVPTFAFDVYLTGYDLQSFNLRDLFSGLGPATGSGVSPDGFLSLPGPPLAGCGDALEIEIPVQHLRAAHSGRPAPLFGNLCAGRDLGDGRARGYLTADVVGECDSGRFPTDPGYFGPGGVARYENALWGSYIYVDPDDNFAQGEALVRLEADAEAFGPGDRTFYGRYVGFDGSDGREPLPPAWATRALFGPGGAPSTEWVTWRETPGPAVPFPCGGRPAWYPLPLTQLVNFDEEENAIDAREVVYLTPPIVPPAPSVPAAAQRDRSLPAFEPVGWLYADLGLSAVEPAQAYVAAFLRHEGRYSVGTAATPLAAACGPRGCELGAEAPPGRLCLQTLDEGDPTLDPGEPARVRVTAAGCYNVCNFVHQAACAVRTQGAGGLEAASRFCINPPAHGCLGPPVCDPVDAVCVTPPLAAGEHALRAGGLELTFSVPAAVPPGGLCAGEF